MQETAKEQLRQFIEQIERLEQEKKDVSEDIRDKFSEAKAMGFDPKIMKQVLKLRSMGKDAREEQEILVHTYLHALGMADETQD